MKTKYMQMAIDLQKKGAGRVSPNPNGGLRDRKEQQDNSESLPSLLRRASCRSAGVKKQARSKSQSATLYVNLEPCCHTDKRTPPCTPEIVKAGIKEVVIGMIDLILA